MRRSIRKVPERRLFWHKSTVNKKEVSMKKKKGKLAFMNQQTVERKRFSPPKRKDTEVACVERGRGNNVVDV